MAWNNKNIYILKRLNSFINESGEFCDTVNDFMFFNLEEKYVSDLNEKIVEINNIIDAIIGWVWQYEKNGHYFHYDNELTIYGLIKDEKDFEKVEKILIEQGFRDSLIDWVKEYYEKVKGTYFHDLIACYDGFYRLSELVTIDIMEGQVLLNNIKIKEGKKMFVRMYNSKHINKEILEDMSVNSDVPEKILKYIFDAEDSIIDWLTDNGGDEGVFNDVGFSQQGPFLDLAYVLNNLKTKEGGEELEDSMEEDENYFVIGSTDGIIYYLDSNLLESY